MSEKIFIGRRLGIDVTAATVAAFGVSPFITIIDRSIIENASGRNSLSASLKQGFRDLLTKPHVFIRNPAFGLIVFVYSSTYAAANIIDTMNNCYFKNQSQGSKEMGKFMGTTIANMTTCIYKDRQFTRMFGTVAPKGLPMASYLLFAARDSMTIAASFNLPPKLASEFHQRQIIQNSENATNLAQLICPAVVQIFSCNFHLLSLDLYNRPNVSKYSRFKFLAKNYLKTTITRIARIAPAFGFGGVGNRVIKNKLSNIIKINNHNHGVVDKRLEGVVVKTFSPNQ